jgi:rare lipoprotein A
MKNLLKKSLQILFLFIHFSAFAQTEKGEASFYHNKFDGRGTSNGEIFRQNKYTCAHKTLPFGTWLKVTRVKNNNVIYVRVNDRLPKSSKRCIDLSFLGAEKLDFIKNGHTPVQLDIVKSEDVPEEFKSKIELKPKAPKKKK